jgi:hypothetical protein
MVGFSLLRDKQPHLQLYSVLVKLLVTNKSVPFLQRVRHEPARNLCPGLP